MDSDIDYTEKIINYITVNKPIYSYWWEIWSRLYNQSYPEYYFINQVFYHYSFNISVNTEENNEYLDVEDNNEYLNYMDCNVLHINGYNNIYYELSEQPINNFIKYVLIYYYLKRFKWNSKYFDYIIVDINNESFDKNYLKL